MKKVLALVLAVLMLATIAFAADKKIGKSTTESGEAALLKPTSKIKIYATAFGITDGHSFDSNNYTISTKKFEKGAALVKSVAFDDADECVVITLANTDATFTFKLDTATSLWTTTGSANLEFDELAVKTKKNLGDKEDVDYVKKGKEYKYDEVNFPTEFYVGTALYEVPTFFDKDDDSITPAIDWDDLGEDPFMMKFKKSGAGSDSYADLEEDVDDMLYIEFRLYDKDVLTLAKDTKVNTSIVKKYPDADLEFYNYNISGFTGKVYVELNADEDEFVYEVVDGKLVPTTLKWDEDVAAWTGKVTKLGSYVISDIDLEVKAAAGETSVANPDTGANDVVNGAIALAAVMALSAAALSLKK